jgi:hypothetical protein
VASFVGVHNKVLLGHLNLTGNAASVNFGDLTRVMQPCTTFADGAYTCVKPGLISGQASLELYQDYAADVLDDEISSGQLGSQYTLTVIPNPTGTVAVADTAWFTRGVVSKINPMDGAKGDMAKAMFDISHDTAILQGKVAHAGAAITTSASDTGIALAGPSSTQRLYSALHVTAYSGFTNVIFTIESDDNANFSSATTRLTHTTVTATTNEFSSAAGSWSSETHHRVKATVTGSGSITFTSAIAVL